MIFIRYFEEGIKKAVDSGRVHCPVYLSIGQEYTPAIFSEFLPDLKVFPQHRGHGWYLAYNGAPEALRDEILGLSTGCSGGKGGSSDIQSDSVIAHNGLIGEQVPVACGYAYQTKQPVVTVFGDGAAEEDYVLSSLGFAATHKLPIIFLCENNNLAILTKIKDRRSWDICKVAEGFGVEAQRVGENDSLPLALFNWDKKSPLLLDVSTTRIKWHVGTGTDNPQAFDLLKTIYIKEMGEPIKKEVERIWDYELTSIA